MTVYNDSISEYITRLFAQQDIHMLNAIASLDQHNLPMIQVKPEEGRFLQFLTCSIQARKVLEIGTLSGYSGMWIAKGLAPGGKIISLEKEIDHARIAMRNFEEAGLSDRVEIRVGDAHQQLKAMNGEGPFDLIFIDAEKTGYLDYLEWAVPNMRMGGIIAAHNAFRKGEILEQEPDEYARVMLEFNRRVAHDNRLCSTIYPAGDGMVVAARVA